MFGIIYTDFRQRTSKLYGNIDRKNLTDLYQILIFKRFPPDGYCLIYIYFYDRHQYLNSKIIFNKQNNK
jgi:hypothetical protein